MENRDQDAVTEERAGEPERLVQDVMDQETANLRMLGMRRMLGMGGFLSARFLIVVVLHLILLK